VYLRLIPGLLGETTLTDTITKDTMTFTIGWVNGAGYHTGAATCNQAGCLGKPALAKQLSGTLIFGPWLQIGPAALNVGAGPAVGIYRDTARVFDTCAGIQAEVNVQPLAIRNTYNLYGPFNLSGTFAKCPLAAH
jgi:hypothetical protein